MDRALPASRRFEILPTLALGIAILGGLIVAFGGLVGPQLLGVTSFDGDAYWDAGQRIREGLSLYGIATSDQDVYRYAPWFAYLWAPLTLFPRELVDAGWLALRVLGGAVIVWSVLRYRAREAVILAVLATALIVNGLPSGNVTPIIVAALLLALPTRYGSVVLGFAGSLKVFPLMLAAGYVAERRWRDVAIAIGVAALLWLPAVWIGMSGYPTGAGGEGFARLGTAVWMIGSALMLTAVAWLAWRRSSWTWLAAAIAIWIVVPRVWKADMLYLLPAAMMVLEPHSEA